MDYEFELPFPPSVNACWRVFKNRSILSKRGREYRAEVINRMKCIGLYNEIVSGRLRVRLELYPPDARRRDIDNYCKATFDALSHAKFWIDDEQIDELTIKRMSKVKGGVVMVRVDLID
tara:strand:- start:1280 stop:1636 length:357 start_codon:yes stop_codon:yes gene_type:complete